MAMSRLIWALTLILAFAANPALAADTHAPDHAKPGLLEPNFFSALWVVIIFVALLLILYPTAWKNVLAGLKAREQRIRTDISEAEAARAKAEATLREYNTQLATAESKVRDMIAQASAQGEQVASTIRTRAEQESQEIKDRALREIDSARKQALADVYEQAASLATLAAEKIIRRNLKPEDQKDLVQQSLEELQTMRN
jgi:F-type H+-transporting ATPase subunit b